MFHPDDHLVRSVFRSLGLYGPLSAAEIEYGYHLSHPRASATESAGLRGADQVTVTHRGGDLVLDSKGTALDAAQLAPFASLDEVLELAELMAATAPLDLRVALFLETRPASYAGQVLAHEHGHRVVGKPIGEFVTTDPAVTDHRVLTHESRRGGVVVDGVVIGTGFSWADFTRPFGTLLTEARLTDTQRRAFALADGPCTPESLEAARVDPALS